MTVQSLLRSLVLVAGLLTAAVAADDPVAVALERAELQYRLALRTLETAGRDQTGEEVRRFREAWQALIAELDLRPPVAEGDTSLAATTTEIDVLVVGALIVIDIGSRDAARAALAPIGQTIAALKQRLGDTAP